MSSLRSRIIIGMLRNRHLFKLKLKPPVITEDFSVDDFRKRIEQISKRINKTKSNIKIEPVDINGVYGEWVIPSGASQNKAVLYIHGGGFISGSCSSHRIHVEKICIGSGVKALLFNYRLAPEYPYPAALNDSVKAYKWLLEQGYKSDNIVIAGDSAGGSLTLSLMLFLKSNGIVMPKSGISISPATDLKCSANSFLVNAKKDIAPINSWKIWTRFYIGDNDVTDPYLSPLYGDLTGLPELYLVIGTNEVHFDDVTSFANKAEENGVEINLKIYYGMVHAFPLLSPLFPEAKKALDDICRFINTSLEIEK